MTELSLFDEVDLPASAAAPKMPERIEPPPKGEDEENDWNEDFELIEDLVGTEAALKIAKAFVGSYIYVPRQIFTGIKHRAIRREYKAGSTYYELCIKYGFSETHIRNIVHNKTGRIRGGDE